MASRPWFTALLLTTLVAAPAAAQNEQRRRERGNNSTARQGERAQEQGTARERAVPRAAEPRRDDNDRLQAEAQRNNNGRNNGRSYDGRSYDSRRYDGGRYDARRYDYRRAVPRRYTPRVIRPVVVRVIPYRPYVYRPSYSIGVYYGANGYYPYGRTPPGYFEPIRGRYYGGVRITGLPRDGRVFADGYYVGLVNDFDGVFQHMNLEAGPHHIEVDLGYDGIEFDVYVRPGETTTFRGDRY